MENRSSLDYFKESYVEEYVLPESTPMKDFYRGKKVFLTGGTGFLGILYVEKLLRSGVESLYLLIRPKKGKNPRERLEEIFCGPVYAKLEKIDPNYLDRITIIEGDVGAVDLGISNEDVKTLIDNVQIVIHAAADVNFEQTLVKLVYINVRGTRDMLRLAEKLKKLEVFSYISTAYSHCPRIVIDEKFYPAAVDPHVMIKFAEKYENQPELLDTITPRIIFPWPNSYTYSKSLSEELVRSYNDKLSICVIRPTIVIATHEDPIPAWCNNIYGLNGVVVAIGIGVLRLLPFKMNLIGDVVCADFVINSTLAAIWFTYNEKKKSNTAIVKKDPEIYHVSTYTDRPTSWNDIKVGMCETFAKYPSTSMLWKHSVYTTACPFMIKLMTIYCHVLPGICVDTFLSITKNKKRLLPVYRKVQRFMAALQYFTQKEWKFSNINMKRILAKMTKDDQEFFPSDVRRFHFSEYCLSYTHGLKLYLSLESINSVEEARKRYKKLVILNFIVVSFFYSIHILLLYTILKNMGIFTNIQNSFYDTIEFLKNPNN